MRMICLVPTDTLQRSQLDQRDIGTRKGGIAIRKERSVETKERYFARKEGRFDRQLTTKTAPNRPMRSGIVSVIIHHINNLGRANLKGASGDREGAQGQDTAEPSDQDDR
ncbi:hypothetical protein KEM48_006507 [Puccinia striiformis f. sp. tritici PST-130]|nr:hypothetical protein KEM48_006507 [Puccinia striiformis f. sp. tritici PST-130]